ncbi:substrate-binding periplasmic protein [Rheinheimera aquimaris]|uniref:substrate-binding periplasmic protein n=1 Tax=Rheinheimera aquimaris TaxID=412437 RepID=UPI003A979C05
MLRLLLLLACISAALPLHASQLLKWCAWEFPGSVSFDNPSKEAQGVTVDFMHELAKRAGFKLVISKATPPGRCIKELGDGSSDLVVGIIKTGDGREDIDYIPYGARHPDRVYLAADDNRKLEQVTELSTMTLAAIRNFGFHPDVTVVIEAMPPQQIIRVNSVYSALEVVAKKRVTAALLPPTLVSAVLQKHPGLNAQIREVSFPVSIVKPQRAYIGLSKHCQCPQLSAAVQTSLQQMTADGSIKAIFGDIIIPLF